MVRTMVNRHTVKFADQDMHFFASDVCTPNNRTRSKRGQEHRIGLDMVVRSTNIADYKHHRHCALDEHVPCGGQTDHPATRLGCRRQGFRPSLHGFPWMLGIHKKYMVCKLRVRGCRNRCRNGDWSPARVEALRGVRVCLRRSIGHNGRNMAFSKMQNPMSCAQMHDMTGSARGNIRTLSKLCPTAPFCRSFLGMWRYFTLFAKP